MDVGAAAMVIAADSTANGPKIASWRSRFAGTGNQHSTGELLNGLV